MTPEQKFKKERYGDGMLHIQAQYKADIESAEQRRREAVQTLLEATDEIWKSETRMSYFDKNVPNVETDE